MFGAKLFSIAAVAIALIASAPIWPSLLMVGTYFVVWRHAILAFALLCGLFAGFYYLADRLLAHRLSKGVPGELVRFSVTDRSCADFRIARHSGAIHRDAHDELRMRTLLCVSASSVIVRCGSKNHELFVT